MVARHARDQPLIDWCAVELGGYNDVEIPAYRTLPASLFMEAFGRHIPIAVEDAEMHALMSKWPTAMQISRIEHTLANAPTWKLRSDLPPGAAQAVQELVGYQGIPFHRVEVSAFTTIIATVRQRVFDWASEQAALGLKLDIDEVTISRVLGIQPPAPVQVPPTNPLASLSVSAAAGAQVTILQHSDGNHIQKTVNQEAVAALNALASALDQAMQSASGQASEEQLAQVEGLSKEIRMLAEMGTPRPGLVRSSWDAVGEFLKDTGSAVAVELAKPHAQAALAAVAKTFGF